MRLERQGMNKTPLIFGKCIHAAIYAAYDNPSLAFEIFCKYWDEEGGSHIQDDARNENHARLIFEAFHSFHKSSRMYIPLSPPGGITKTKECYSDVEAPLLIDCNGEYPLYGKIDRLVQWMNNIWPLDYKTSSQITDSVCRNHNTCIQTLAYVLMASVLYNTVLKGIIYEFLRVTKTITNHETYVHPVYVKDHWLSTFVDWYIYQATMIKKMNEEMKWPKNPSACSPYGQHGVHGYVCEFHDICDSEDWTTMLKYYDINPFNPLEGVNDIKILEVKR